MGLLSVGLPRRPGTSESAGQAGGAAVGAGAGSRVKTLACLGVFRGEITRVCVLLALVLWQGRLVVGELWGLEREGGAR